MHTVKGIFEVMKSNRALTAHCSGSCLLLPPGSRLRHSMWLVVLRPSRNPFWLILRIFSIAGFSHIGDHTVERFADRLMLVQFHCSYLLR